MNRYEKALEIAAQSYFDVMTDGEGADEKRAAELVETWLAEADRQIEEYERKAERDDVHAMGHGR